MFRVAFEQSQVRGRCNKDPAFASVGAAYGWGTWFSATSMQLDPAMCLQFPVNHFHMASQALNRPYRALGRRLHTPLSESPIRENLKHPKGLFTF